VALQKGRPIFSLSTSFQIEEQGFDHQDAAPEAEGPEGLRSELELAREYAQRIPAPLRTQAVGERPIEIRPLTPYDPIAPRRREPERRIWYRAIDALPDQPSLHQFLLAYASDFHFLTTALEPHGVSWLTPGMQMASLNHAMWFHRPFRMDEWMLYVVDSPSASGARGLVRGHFFTRDGRLAASTAQEGLLRMRGRAASETRPTT
jgi:acyl-CoA thioesterase-2